MKTQFVRQTVVFEDHFKEFRKTLDKEALMKLYQVMTLIMKVEVVPIRFLKAIRGRKGLYEIRSETKEIYIGCSAVLMRAIL